MPAVRRALHPRIKPTAPPANVRRILSIDSVAEALDRTTMSIYRYIREEPNFPQPIRLGGQRIGFYEDELAAYIEQLPRAADKPTHRNGKTIGKKKIKAA